MGKNAKKSKKNKAMKVDKAKQTLAQETASEPSVADLEAVAPQETGEPIETEKDSVAVAKTPAEESKKPIKAIQKVDRAKPAKKSAPKQAPAAKAEPAKKPGRKPMTAAEKAATAKARAEEKKKADAMTPTLTMQYGGRDIDVKALVQAAKDDFKANHKRTLLTELNLYLKPEDSTMYYVANGSVEGKISF